MADVELQKIDPGLTRTVNMQVGAKGNMNGRTMGVLGMATAGMQVTGTFTGTIVNFEATIDDTNWVALPCTNVANGVVASTTAAAGVFVAPVAALRSVRARVSNYTGTDAVTVGGMAVTGGQGPFSNLIRVSETITFTGAAGLGAVGAVPLFTVVGTVLVAILVPYCGTALQGATATIELGIIGNTSGFIAATTATGIGAGDVWVDATPTENQFAAIPSALKDIAIGNYIVATVAVADITAGMLRFDLYWMPLSSDGNVVAA